MNNGLIICPDCLQKEIRRILGSVTPEGDLTIMRYRHEMTTIKAPKYQVICQCGFGTVIINTTNGHAAYTYPLPPEN